MLAVTNPEVGTIAVQAADLALVCRPENDLYQTMAPNHIACDRYDFADAALAAAGPGSAVMILADDYPDKKTRIPAELYEAAQTKGVKLYVEFPDLIPSGATGEITSTRKERLVVTSNFFGPELPAMSLLDAGLFKVVAVPARESLVSGAKVAGFDTAVYGLADTPNFPVLFEDHGVLVSTTKLSDFNKSRYSPLGNWATLLRAVLMHLSVVKGDVTLQWTPLVRPSHSKDTALPEDARRAAVARGTEWYIKGRFLIHPQWKERWYDVGVKGARFPVGAPIEFELPSGDGTLGVMEGHYSFLNPDGSQQYRYWLRADCVAETAMTFALANEINPDAAKKAIATNLMNFLLNTDTFKTTSSKEAMMASYGLIGWASTHAGIYYGDDNARVLLGSIMAAQLLGDRKWDNDILKCMLGNYRTTGAKGFRGSRLESDQIDAAPWSELMQAQRVNPHPHYESWLWANYLWLYDKTNYAPLFEKAKTAIEITMSHYPDRWKWTNGIQQERARMILPLAWLVRVEDTQQHRNWLNSVVNDLLKSQMPCGAIREEVGKSGGQYGPTRSNEKYGTNEAPVIYRNGDPISDMLYTSNFAFFSLNEAAQVTRDPVQLQAVQKLSDFLVRIQSRSDGRPDLDGCWFRAFDFETWEYYGSNADHGWGAWGTLTGWTQSFITSTLAMQAMQTSFWDLTKTSTVGSDMDSVCAQMLVQPEPKDAAP